MINKIKTVRCRNYARTLPHKRYARFLMANYTRASFPSKGLEELKSSLQRRTREKIHPVYIIFARFSVTASHGDIPRDTVQANRRAANIVSNLSSSKRIQHGVVRGRTKTVHTCTHASTIPQYGGATLPCLCINKMAHKTSRR